MASFILKSRLVFLHTVGAPARTLVLCGESAPLVRNTAPRKKIIFSRPEPQWHLADSHPRNREIPESGRAKDDRERTAAQNEEKSRQATNPAPHNPVALSPESVRSARNRAGTYGTKSRQFRPACLPISPVQIRGPETGEGRRAIKRGQVYTDPFFVTGQKVLAAIHPVKKLHSGGNEKIELESSETLRLRLLGLFSLLFAISIAQQLTSASEH
ncbi:uncharacterized protein LOC129747815 isoform X1 [Uranotaenia lowii]|uniref:uncharacterized protein LOC129747815 isoform X1 n=1 Tax=Uranotaenia lowii TaxID=190385 RepID=UPI0024793DF9|nr:uncharacterized protein LOC129747815 isoform X1 [Uranotaenia lowii]